MMTLDELRIRLVTELDKPLGMRSWLVSDDTKTLLRAVKDLVIADDTVVQKVLDRIPPNRRLLGDFSMNVKDVVLSILNAVSTSLPFYGKMIVGVLIGLIEKYVPDTAMHAARPDATLLEAAPDSAKQFIKDLFATLKDHIPIQFAWVVDLVSQIITAYVIDLAWDAIFPARTTTRKQAKPLSEAETTEIANLCESMTPGI